MPEQLLSPSRTVYDTHKKQNDYGACLLTDTKHKPVTPSGITRKSSDSYPPQTSHFHQGHHRSARPVTRL